MPPRDKSNRAWHRRVKQRSHASRLVLPVWLLGILSYYNIPTEADMKVLGAVALLWIIPFGSYFSKNRFFLGPLFEEHPLSLYLFLCFALISLPVSLFSVNPPVSVGYLLVTVAGVVACAGVWRLLSLEEMLHALRVYAGGGLILIFLLEYSIYTGGRLGVFRSPNSIGLILISLLLSCLSFKSRWARSIFMCLGSFLLFLTGSRASAGAVTCGLLVYSLFNWRNFSLSVRILIFAVLPTAVWLLCFRYYATFEHVFLNGFLAISDPYRGVGSGLTGRLYAWQEAIEIWLANPGFGVGFRIHELHMSEYSSSHNGYISLLAETGIVGALPIVALAALGGRRLLKGSLAGQRDRRIGFSLYCSYLFVALFERFFINFGNPTSVLFLVFLLAPASGSLEKRYPGTGGMEKRRRVVPAGETIAVRSPN